MAMDATTAAVPATLNELLAEVAAEVAKGTVTSPANALVSVLRRHHFWPALQVKKFFDDSNLTLLHNTYKRIDVDHFKALYDECRSVVLDLTAPEGKNIVVTYAQSIPTRMTIGQYVGNKRVDDVCTLSYEGTVITVYEHDGKWRFGTSTCPIVDSSRYFHPTKTHGTMVDEAIAKLLGESPETTSVELRAKFAERLDKNKAYAFLLVHHENKHIMDYTEEFGDGYAVLLQVSTRDRVTLDETQDTADIVTQAPLKFETPEAALEYLSQNDGKAYGIFVKRTDGSLLKVSTEAIVRREEVDLGSSNVWQNFMHVYMQRIPDFHIKDYIQAYVGDFTFPKASNGAKLSPTHVIHMTMSALRDIIYNAYRSSTHYTVAVNKYRINREVDESFASIIKFHVAQLRYFQITHHTHRPITMSAVFSYLCHHNTMKNMRLLVEHVATNTDKYPMGFESMECIRILNQHLKQQ